MAKGYCNTLFTRVKTQKPPVNKFDLSHDKMLTAQMGRLCPVLCQEMVPGDRFRVQSDLMCRTVPLVSPAFGSLKAYIHYFFVPNRLLWDQWEDFITGGEDGTDRPVPPYVQYNDLVYDAHTRTGENYNVGSGCLWDYFGLPLADWDSTSGGNATPISLLPFKAYSLIYNEYYRDQNVDPEYEIFVDQSGRQVLNSSGRFGFSFHFDVPRRRWLKDYFTSALPTPQRGPDVTLPIAGQANVVLSETNNAGRFVAPNSAIMAPPDRYDVIASNINTPTSGYSISAAPSKTESGYSLTYDPNGSLKADLSTATAVTINDLRRAIALQKFYEISARAGSRYKETMMGHFRVMRVCNVLSILVVVFLLLIFRRFLRLRRLVPLLRKVTLPARVLASVVPIGHLSLLKSMDI